MDAVWKESEVGCYRDFCAGDCTSHSVAAVVGCEETGQGVRGYFEENGQGDGEGRKHCGAGQGSRF